MEEIPENEDCDPRPTYSFQQANLLGGMGLITAPMANWGVELAVAISLLFLALVFSGLRAAYSAVAAFEAPWDKKKLTFITPNRQQRFLLLLLQRIAMLLAFVIAGDIAILFPENGMYYFGGGVLLWLLLDAYARLFAGKNALAITQATAKPIHVVLNLLSPIGNLFFKIAQAIRLIPTPTLEEVATNEAIAEEIQEEKDLILGVTLIGQTIVRQAMVSRSDITGFDRKMDFHELMDKVNKSGFSRIPVYDGELDHIEGILYVKDLLPYIQQDEHFNWQRLIRKAYLIPETKKLNDLLEEFQKRRVHMAIVVDEYGGASGLITLEDIIEEIFGEINDEYDGKEDHNYEKIDESTYIFEGKSLLNDVIRTLGLPSEYFDDDRRGSETLGGFTLELFEGFPKVGEELEYRNMTLKIHSATKKMIRKVKVIMLEQA